MSLVSPSPVSHFICEVQRVTWHHMAPKNVRNLGVTSRLVFFLPSQASIASFKPFEPQSLIWAILTYRDTWGSDETKVVTLSYKQRCFILKWVLCIFIIIFCLPLSPRALLTSLPLAALVCCHSPFQPGIPSSSSRPWVLLPYQELKPSPIRSRGIFPSRWLWSNPVGLLPVLSDSQHWKTSSYKESLVACSPAGL